MLSATRIGATQIGAARRIRFSAERRCDHCRCTADAAIHENRLGGAVALAGAAFHTRIPIDDPGFATRHAKDTVRTNRAAHSAAIAARLVQPQGYNARKITEI